MSTTNEPRPPNQFTGITDNQLLEFYSQAETQAGQWDAKAKDNKAICAAIKTELLTRMHESGESSKTLAAGRMTRQETTKFSCEDWDKFYLFIIGEMEIAKQKGRSPTEAFSFFTQSVKQATVKEFMTDEGGFLPPGIKSFSEQSLLLTLNSRKGTKK